MAERTDAAVEGLVDAWCSRHLGSRAREQFFGMQRLSSVHGIRLADGREVTLKVRGAQPRQAACAIVHTALWRAGIPCPEPLAGPSPLVEADDPVLVGGGDGESVVDARTLAVNAETWEGEGVAAVGTMSATDWARLLARMVAAAPPVATLPTLEPAVPWLDWAHSAAERTWSPPASHRWDPHRMDEWIDPVVHDTARRARARLLRPDVAALPRVAGHGDFEAQNCRWVPDASASGRLVVHDWDSIVAMPEAVLAGNSAATFASVVEPELSTFAQNDEFLAAYADARGREWTATEREVAHAAGVWVSAYNAAFEYLKDGPAAVTAGLRDQAEERLRRAGA